MQLHRSRRTTALGAVLGATVLATTALTAAPLMATAAKPPSVVKVAFDSHGIVFAGGNSIPAGHAVFEVRSATGHHALQLVHLHPGYTKKEAGHDIDAAFGGDHKAIKAVDTKMDWLGGAPASPGHPGHFAVRLAPGSYIAFDQNSDASAGFDVVSAPSDYRTTYPSSIITTKRNHFHTHTGGLALPHASWLRFHNNAKEPHMLIIQHVKQSTTRQDVRDYAASGSNKNPSWGLPEATDVGVISPGTSNDFKYNLPAGKYLLMCFWPSIDGGMPHFAMGMWKLVELS